MTSSKATTWRQRFVPACAWGRPLALAVVAVTAVMAVVEARASESPAAELASFVDGDQGYCVQIKSVPTEAEAAALVRDIRRAVGGVVTVFPADLEERGTWYRVCVGAFSSMRAADRAGRGWTSRRGELAPFMEKAVRGQARYLVKRNDGEGGRRLTDAQAAVLAAAGAGPGRRVSLVPAARPHTYLAAMTGVGAGGTEEVLVVGPAGEQLRVDGDAAPHCSACRAALKRSPVRDRRLVAAGELKATPGAELAVEERCDDGSRILVVLEQRAGALGRIAAVWLGTDRPTLRVKADVSLVDVDGDGADELAVRRTELPMVEGRVCAVRRRVELIDAEGETPRRVGVDEVGQLGSAPDGAAAAAAAIHAFDQLGAHEQASEACAAYAVLGRSEVVSKLCVDRIERLRKNGRHVAAVNAAGRLSESSSVLRPLVATAFFKAAEALDTHPHRVVRPDDCVKAPLVDRRGGELDALIDAAVATTHRQPDIGELADPVFVTGRRDFGRKSPVGRMVAGWLDALREPLPARHAAIQALAGPETSADEGSAR